MLDDKELETLEVDEELTPAVAPAKPKAKEKPTPNTAVNTAIPAGTQVSMGALVYRSLARNSVSVRAVQTRLLELGHLGSGSDLPGWLSDGTMEALGEFHSGAKLKGEVLSRETIKALFAGISVKVVD